MATKSTTKKTDSKSDSKTERYTQSLRVQLTPEEVADRADRAAQKLNERDEKEADMKAATKHAKGVIEEIEAQMRQLSTEVRTRSTYRMVDCERVYDYGRGVVEERRLDTFEVLSSRAMTEAERQRELFQDGE